MSLSITAALTRIKDHLADCLEPAAIRQVCQDLGYRWRDRLLDPATTVHLFLLQVLPGEKGTFIFLVDWCQEVG